MRREGVVWVHKLKQKRMNFRYRASTHYRPELTPTERAHKLTLVLQHAAMLIRHTVQDRSTESTSQAFWLANASELLHFLKSDRHVNPFSLQAQDTLADAVQLAFKVSFTLSAFPIPRNLSESR